ncbi:MAG TPA: hypothetical protein VNA69_20365 [Thermoanaerobaculia bacterium]|nr:hypothetical protein [Thermoanaerobaculia bacterium]
MPRRTLLPGVTADSCPPAVACDAHSAIRGARRRAIVRDVAQVVLLVAVDYLFIRWPESHVPLLTRAHSLAVLQVLNALVVADVWLTRALPMWWARRIASTWCRSEREKFQRRPL